MRPRSWDAATRAFLGCNFLVFSCILAVILKTTVSSYSDEGLSSLHALAYLVLQDLGP